MTPTEQAAFDAIVQAAKDAHPSWSRARCEKEARRIMGRLRKIVIEKLSN